METEETHMETQSETGSDESAHSADDDADDEADSSTEEAEVGAAEPAKEAELADKDGDGDGVHDDSETATVGGINPVKLKEEWRDVKHLLRDHKRKSLKKGEGANYNAFTEFGKDIMTTFAYKFPNTALIVSIAMTTPMASVSCERAFSRQNRIKTKFRSRLSVKSLTQLMTIASGDNLDQFDFDAAITVWQAAAGSGRRV